MNDKMEVVRSAFEKLYAVIDINCDYTDETETAIKKIKEAQFWIELGNKLNKENIKCEGTE